MNEEQIHEETDWKELLNQWREECPDAEWESQHKRVDAAIAEREKTNERVEAWIAEARRILNPSPVRAEHVPDWLRRRMLKAFPSTSGHRHRNTRGWAVLQDALRSFAHSSYWCDHPGSTWMNGIGGTAFVVEPYTLNQYHLAEIAEFARQVGCKYEVSANSWHFPGNTVRVIFFGNSGPTTEAKENAK